MSYRRIPTRIAQPAHVIVQRAAGHGSPCKMSWDKYGRRLPGCAGLGLHPSEMAAPFTPTTAFAQAVDPYSWRMSRPGAVYAPYGWGPDFNIGMPFNYTHHIGYERVPVPGARRIGPMYDRLPGPAGAGCVPCGMAGSWSGSQPGHAHVASSAALAGILAVM